MIGETLDGKYKLVALLGEGGMGSVYEAQQLETGRRVAVKTIKTEKTERGSEARSRFRRECLAAREIESDYIVQILDSGEDEASGNLYLVMERLDGEDLQRLLDREGALPPDVALRIAGQALHGLATAHEAGVVHRDIKPANLYVSRMGEEHDVLKVLDFGVARLPQAARPLTEEGLLFGTPDFMSPEVCAGERADARSDLYSLAASIYFMLTGGPLFPDSSVNEVILKHISRAPDPPSSRAAGIPADLDAVVMRCLAKEPGERYASAAAFGAALAACASAGDWSPRHAAGWWSEHAIGAPRKSA